MMNKAVFLDRDGVLIRERGNYNYKLSHVELVDGVVENLKALNRKGYLLIVITNQGGINKKIYTHQQVREIHKLIRETLSTFHVSIKDFYYCPHHDQFQNCLCRKPNSLLLEKAIAVHNIDPASSFFVGDSERDVEAAKKAGVTPVKIEANENWGKYFSN